MIVKSGTSLDGRQILLLGLTQENVESLLAGRPIAVSRSTHGDGVPAGLDVGIFFGATKDDLMRELAPYVGPDTLQEDRSK
jgi:hypothetical protein